TRMTRAMDYIEAHLDGELDWGAVAREALCPPQQFARMFAMMTDVPLSEYVRRRRLTRAALDLQRGEGRVLDVALRYGYASPTAFQRAFQQFHGAPPSHARRQGVRLRSYPPMTFQFTIKGGTALQYRIEEKPGFRVVGYREEISMVGGENFRRIPELWNTFPRERCDALIARGDGQYPGMLGLIDMGPRDDTLAYWIAVSSASADLAPWMQAMDVPAATYAVFDTSLATLQDVTRRIFAEWLPSSGYEHGPSAELEYYPDGDMSDPAQYMCEIWIPVVKG
ncbi:AraC family transcriptional regulator, partial [Eubacteriales bacterium OttesenSCG-928-A19]|nr:AraC family transcriptional regulator [Eubacteriales bacterium OttesenSCG-928-A19]